MENEKVPCLLAHSKKQKKKNLIIFTKMGLHHKIDYKIIKFVIFLLTNYYLGHIISV